METYDVELVDGTTVPARDWADVLSVIKYADVKRVTVSVNGELSYHITVHGVTNA